MAEIQSIDVRQHIKLVFANRLTVAVLTVDGQGDSRQPLGVGISLCHPQDTYNRDLGADLAITRAYADWGRDAQDVLNEGIDQRCRRLKEVTKLRAEAQSRAEEIKDMSAEEVLEATLERKPLKPSEKPPEERSPLDLLIVGRELIQDPKWWVKGTTWRSVDSRVDNGEDAVCPGMCATGAVWAAGGGLDPNTGETRYAAEVTNAYRIARRFLDRAVIQLSKRRFTSTTSFNDAVKTKHSDVMSAFNTAIAMAKAEGN